MKKKLFTIFGVIAAMLMSGCGATTPAHDHVWATEWSKNSTKHWHACIVENCTERHDAAAHVFDKKAAKTSCLKSAATCTSKAVYYYSCECGAKGTETFEYGQALGHSPSATYSSNAYEHWKACTNAGCDEKLYKGYHSGGSATVDEQAHCDTCGKGYGETLNKNEGMWSPLIPLN